MNRIVVIITLTFLLVFTQLFASRMFDPQMARWMEVDPADEFNSPYVYCGNNPILFVDPDGKRTEIYIHSGNTWYGHAAINVNGNVYTYGRYGENNDLRSGGLKGDGILYVFTESEYFEKSSPKDLIERFNVKYTPEQEATIVKFFDELIAGGTPQDDGTKINEYKFTLSNCTTLTIDSLPDGFLKSFLEGLGIFRPQDLGDALQMTDLITDQVDQIDSIPPKE